VDFLVENKVEILADVRESPLSKKSFSKNALKEKVNNTGLEYVHFKDPGPKRELRNKYKENKDWGEFSRDFRNYLDKQTAVIPELERTVLQHRFA